jgi:DNA-binding NtrC family response regulator
VFVGPKVVGRGGSDGGKAGRHRTARFGRKRILLVEDNKGIRDIVVSILTSAEYQCRAASSGMKALAMLESGSRFDLMICDLRNKSHGLIPLAQAKQRVPTMLVVVMTPQTCPCTAQFAVSAMLMKPFTANELLVTLYPLIEGRRRKFLNGVGVA